MLIFRSSVYWILPLLLLLHLEGRSQQCIGNFIPAQQNINFGSDKDQYAGPNFYVQNYTHVRRSPNEGEYTIVHSTSGTNPLWYQDVSRDMNNVENDHAYIMIVNAKADPGIFFQKDLDGFCPNTVYELSPIYMNLLNSPGPAPNLEFVIEDDRGNVLTRYATGNIRQEKLWTSSRVIFTTPSNFQYLVLKASTVNPGGPGNDFAMAGFDFYKCEAEKTKVVFANAQHILELCSGANGDYELKALSPPIYQHPSFRWQKKEGINWVDLDGENTEKITVTITKAIEGLYYYRVLVAEGPGIPSLPCASASEEAIIGVYALPNAIIKDVGPACKGMDIQLSADGGARFEWSGPNNFSSSLRNPIIRNVSSANAGIYHVKVSNGSNCTSQDQFELQVVEGITGQINSAEITICEGQTPVQLQASGGAIYRWSPPYGLSNPNIANPTASPSTTTIYTVDIGNGTCSDIKSVKIIVVQTPKANAGADRKILIGQKISLNGVVTGDHITFRWSPTEGVDNPLKLNPVVSPKKDTKYTLTVTSSCNTVSDEVFVKVYDKVEVPSAFSPNGDGINDTWNIPSISSFPNVKLDVINRHGQTVFQSHADPNWDGKRNGKDLPVGTYYYMIYLDRNYPYYTGLVTIVR